MKEHDVFRHSDGRIETVKRGWSWPVCLFCWFWTRGDFRLQAFTNVVDGDAFNLLLGDAQSPGRSGPMSSRRSTTATPRVTRR